MTQVYSTKFLCHFIFVVLKSGIKKSVFSVDILSKNRFLVGTEKKKQRKIRENLVKSSIFRRKIGKYRFFHRKIATVEHARLCWNFLKNIDKYRKNIGKISVNISKISVNIGNDYFDSKKFYKYQ